LIIFSPLLSVVALMNYLMKNHDLLAKSIKDALRLL
jgi:hypothetical protein